MDKTLFRERLFDYLGNSGHFNIYYDKIYKKEYLPSRIRYNQFFFYGALISFSYLLLS